MGNLISSTYNVEKENKLLRQQNEELKKKNEELNNTITAINNEFEIVCDQYKEMYQKKLEEIHEFKMQHVTNLEKLINEETNSFLDNLADLM